MSARVPLAIRVAVLAGAARPRAGIIAARDVPQLAGMENGLFAVRFTNGARYKGWFQVGP